MATFLKALRRNGEAPDPTPSALEAAIQRADTQTDKLDRLVRRAESAARLLDSLDGVTDRLAAIEGQSALLEEIGPKLAGVNEQTESLAKSHRRIEAQLRHATTDVERMQKLVDDMRSQVDATVSLKDSLADEASQTKHQLSTLHALSDQLTLKAAALEQQRGAIAKVAAQADALTGIARQVDEGLRKHGEQAEALERLESHIGTLNDLHEQVLARSDEFKDELRDIDAREAAVTRSLEELERGVRANAESFDHESNGLASLGERVADLRTAVASCEEQLAQAERTAELIADVGSRTEQLAQRATAIADQVTQLQHDAGRLSALHAEAERLDSVVDAVASRVDSVETALPTLDKAVEDLATLSRTREAIHDSVEQMRLVYDESLRLREGQSETKSWLEETRTRMTELQSQVSDLNAARPVVEALRRESERISAAMESLESQRMFVEEAHQRLIELGREGAQLEERTAGLGSRLDRVEGQFKAVTMHADEAERVAGVIGKVTGDVQEAQRRAGEIERTLEASETRSREIQQLADQTRHLTDELTQREEALRKAMEHLDRASELRQEAADVAQRLGEEKRDLQRTLSESEDRAVALKDLITQLEDRSNGLRFVEKRLVQFEEQLGAWEDSERAVTRGLDQLQVRQRSVDALQADIKRLFDIAERSAQDVQAIRAARQEIGDTRAEIERALLQVTRADEAAQDLDARRRQLDNAEKRLAKADALVMNIRSSLEMLHTQKAVVDHAVQQAGALTFESKQAEALIDRLREERTVTDRVRLALVALQEDERDETYQEEEPIAEAG